MRKFLSLYLVAATWAFLVLPTCPCQLLMAFGIDVQGTLNGPSEVSLNSETNGYPIGHCHCEDDVLKSAEVVDPSVDGEVEWSSDDSALLDYGFIDAPLRLAQLGESIVHPPPWNVGSWLSESEGLCVFRL